MTHFDRELEERLIRYAAIDTQSDETSATSPSTDRQFDLLRMLADELCDIGAANVPLSDYGVVLATRSRLSIVTCAICWKRHDTGRFGAPSLPQGWSGAFSIPIRGGTDGSRLTEKGVPTPNIFTGMAKVHGPLEWVSVQDMAAATQVCLALAELATSAIESERGCVAQNG